MEQIYKEIVSQVLSQRKTAPKQGRIEVQFRLGHIQLYNKAANESDLRKPLIQPLYQQLPNKKIVKHHQFRAQIEETQFQRLIEHLKTQYKDWQEQTQTDYVYPDESKLTLETIEGVREIVRSVKKSPLLQDIDITTQGLFDARFSCKGVVDVEINTKVMQPQTQRNKTLIAFKALYYSCQRNVEVVCSSVSRPTANGDQTTREVEVRTLAFPYHTDLEIQQTLQDLFQTLNIVIAFTSHQSSNLLLEAAIK